MGIVISQPSLSSAVAMIDVLEPGPVSFFLSPLVAGEVSSAKSDLSLAGALSRRSRSGVEGGVRPIGHLSLTGVTGALDTMFMLKSSEGKGRC